MEIDKVEGVRRSNRYCSICNRRFASPSKLKRHCQSRCHNLRILSLKILAEVHLAKCIYFPVA